MVDMIVTNAKVTTLDRTNPEAEAFAIRKGLFLAVGSAAEIKAVSPDAKVLNAGGRRIIPGLIDSHTHLIRGGLNYNLELRWDGVPTLAEALAMLETQAGRTPESQWVRVVGGFSAHQFAERRLPTIRELNAVAPQTAVFILHLHDRALLNAAALRQVGYTRSTRNPPGGEIVRDAAGEPIGLMLTQPSAILLYEALSQCPKLPHEYQLNSTRHFLRELNRLGITSAIDAGGAGQSYPGDYSVIEELHRERQLTVRTSYNLSAQVPKREFADLETWVKSVRPGQGDPFYRLNGAGEVLVHGTGDFSNLASARPPLVPVSQSDLEAIVRLLAEHQWPWRMHAAYDDTISRALDIFERVHRDIPIDRLHWFFDHAETISEHNIDRVAALGGGIAIQHRMAYHGEAFAERYGWRATESVPPIGSMIRAGLPVGAGTDATRAASFNPWVALSWLVTGRTVGASRLYPLTNRLDRLTALRLWTSANAWFSNEVGQKGQIRSGQFADFAVLSDDYFAVPDEAVAGITSTLTAVGGEIVHACEEFSHLSPDLPPVMPEWSPTAEFAGFWRATNTLPGWSGDCTIHGHNDRAVRQTGPVVADPQGFWEALGCSCWPC